MKNLLTIPLLFVCLVASGQDIKKQGKDIPTPETFYNKVVEIQPAIPGEEKVLWKLGEDGKATNLYEKKETSWKIKNNMLHIGKKRYHLTESSFVFLEYGDTP